MGGGSLSVGVAASLWWLGSHCKNSLRKAPLGKWDLVSVGAAEPCQGHARIPVGSTGLSGPPPPRRSSGSSGGAPLLQAASLQESASQDTMERAPSCTREYERGLRRVRLVTPPPSLTMWQDQEQ